MNYRWKALQCQGSSGVLSDTGSMTEGKPNPDLEKSLREARLALKTGMSAYENDNFKLAEPLLIKSLDGFEATGSTEDPDFFQCLVSLADTYYHLRRYYEAKGYYERLSVGRLKNADSSDAQVVVALLKLAATHEKLQEVEDALTTFELTLALAEKTIPKGHALFNVIFDSFEILIERHVVDPTERSERSEALRQKREQFAYTDSQSGLYQALQKNTEGMTAAERLLAQPAEDIRKNLSAWTHTEISSWASEVRVQRARNTLHGLMAQPVDPGQSLAAPSAQEDKAAEGFSVRNLGSNSSSSNRVVADESLAAGSSDAPANTVDEIWANRGSAAQSSESDEKRPALRLSAEMFKRKARETHGFTEEPQANRAASDEEFEHTVLSTGTIDQADGVGSASKASRTAVKKLNTDKRFNPMPLISTVAAIGVTLGAMYLAREYTRSMVPRPVANAAAAPGIDLSGKEYRSADRKRVLRFVTRSSLELVDRERNNLANYHIKGEPAPPAMGGLFGAPQKMTLIETVSGFSMPDGSCVYGENTDDLKVIDKMQGIANFANYFFAKHDKVYPGAEQDFDKRFGWDNPITGDVNKPVIAKEIITKEDFDDTFIKTLNDMRLLKPRFAADDADKAPPGLIECITLSPANAATASDTGSGIIIRAYDSAGKLIRSSDPNKAFVLALKNGISVDPIKASRTQDDLAPFFDPGKNYEVELNLLKKEAAKAK